MKSHTHTLALLIALSMPAVLAGTVPVSVSAATLTVDTTTDDASLTACDDAISNDCSLRGAIIKANGLSEASTIHVPAGTYVLTQSARCVFHVGGPTNTETRQTTALCIDHEMTLVGAGAATTAIDGNQPSGDIGAGNPVMFVGHGATVEIRGLTMENGNFSGSSFIGHGGGIRNFGTLTLTECVLSDNFGGRNGGAVYNTGDLRVVRSALTHNATLGEGGAVANFAGGMVTVSESVISDNSADNGGGGIYNGAGTVTIVNSTISGNTSRGAGGSNGFGGGLWNGRFNTVRLTNVTVSGNRAQTGGGIANDFVATMHLQNVTVTNNTAQWFTDPTSGVGGGIFNTDQATLTVQNTLIAGNVAAGSCSINGCFPAGPDCFAFAGRSGALTSQGYNLIQDTDSCDIAGDTTGNIYAQAPKLGLLADNAGPTSTHALLSGSPAIDAGSPALPGSGATACAAVDQRGVPRPQGPRCDIGAYEASQGVPPLLVLPNHGGNGGAVVAIVYGLDAPDGSTVKLSRTGQPDIPGDPVAVAGPSVLGTSFDLTGKTTGSWDVVVTKPDHSSAKIAQGFTIEDTRLPTMWVDVIGRTVVRVGRPALFTVLFGNRGNVDAVAVPLVLTIPANVTAALGFQVTPPPPQAGQVPTDWSQVPVAPQIDGLTYVPLLLPVVPAGFTGTLELRVTAQPASVDMHLEINAEIGAGTAVSLLGTEGVDRLVADARVFAEHTLGVDIPLSRVSALAQYVTTQLQTAVAHGRNTVVVGAGTGTEVYSLPQLIADAAKFGAALATASAPRSPRPIDVAPHAAASSSLSSEPAGQAAMPATSRATSIARRIATLLLRFMAAVAHTLVALLQPSEAEAQSPSQRCMEEGLSYDSRTGRCLGCVGSFCGRGKSPFDSKASRDPNDKVGAQGVGTERFVTAADPLRYAIFFENKPTASLPAQEVLLTDQLDSAKMDLDTFSLGPLSFGNTVVVPPPGLAQFSTSVDLRPSKDLLVAIDARLDKASGLVSWRFSSLDPATLQAPDDPSAGFLPPNNSASDGEGGVLFTVKLKAGLAAGTQITNQASVIFDVNAPIVTPTWLNTIDDAKPASHVLSLATTQSSPSFAVRWAGTDQGSGILDYSVFVSEDGGPFAPFFNNTADTSATFPGKAGKSYSFYSVARDQVGNVEDKLPGAEATTQIAAVGESRLLTALSSAKVWVGLKNSDDVGLRVDLRAEVLVGTTVVGHGQIDNVSTGGSGFNNAILSTIPLSLDGSPAVTSGSALKLRLAVRRTCSGTGHASGTARLWYNNRPVDSGAARDAGTRFGATLGDVNASYYARANAALSTSAGSSRISADMLVNSTAACPSRGFTSFGTWSLTLP